MSHLVIKTKDRNHSKCKIFGKGQWVSFTQCIYSKVKSIENNTKLFGSNFVIPGSEKKALIILNYTAKFGIKNDVTIKDNGNHNYQVTLPKFEVIGVELDKDKPYTLYDTSGGILSYSTKDIDTGEAVAEGFSNKEQQGFIKDNKNY